MNLSRSARLAPTCNSVGKGRAFDFEAAAFEDTFEERGFEEGFKEDFEEGFAADLAADFAAAFFVLLAATFDDDFLAPSFFDFLLFITITSQETSVFTPERNA